MKTAHSNRLCIFVALYLKLGVLLIKSPTSSGLRCEGTALAVFTAETVAPSATSPSVLDLLKLGVRVTRLDTWVGDSKDLGDDGSSLESLKTELFKVPHAHTYLLHCFSLHHSYL